MHMIIIIDFGSQYNQLIARRVREHQVYCQILPPDTSFETIQTLDPKGIILSGGPASIYEKGPEVDARIFDLNIPILGICYGMQFMVHKLGGQVQKASLREYGHAQLYVKDNTSAFYTLPEETPCWMSHGDVITRLPDGFKVLAVTDNSPYAAIFHAERKWLGLQFHPEVAHTPEGKNILGQFLFALCQCQPNWNMDTFVTSEIDSIKQTVGNQQVILGLSGGVDSSVTACLIHKSIGNQLTCIFVDNGLLRKNETQDLQKIFAETFQMNIIFVDARNRFLSQLKGVTDPEQKRKIIGRLFISVFENEAAKIQDAKFLAQGTLYPDIIESQSAFGGPSAVIKSHHNVGGLPEKMNLTLIEPLKYLFKDEVRKLGQTLGLPERLIFRHPFPGPGLGIRILGEITENRLAILRDADAILLEEIEHSGYYNKLWQSFVVLLPLKTVGIMGDQRTYENIAAIRAVTSIDAMTADWAKLPHDLLGKISNRIINEVMGINRVVYDISSKPPATIEWE
ncbi:MAG: GMP synthase glutamine-hydrolyzing [Candidatus Magnetoglobus multicellularis str. Araruama]|uniref:GMP synthase [glutamine-hydrolyzing] n=1 Tax=Candidatus Magnetoglobus multicellularis str. Araruama TaxID=890399 RepID=A0A1V1PCR6_9BACT|nr:MAG: GMP synthase glutamine-hydrolyzing [Candidatus Magnetoglobus multicellularis str. Araruama]